MQLIVEWIEIKTTMNEEEGTLRNVKGEKSTEQMPKKQTKKKP